MLQDLHVLEIPTKTNFRGINTREIAIFHGPNGWSEFSPFIEYGDVEAKVWLKAALEGAYKPHPKLAREKIEINATLPKVEVNKVEEILNLFPGAKVVKIKFDDFSKDAILIEKVLEVLPQARIRLDINGGWSLDSARKNLELILAKYLQFIDYFEQPCESLSELKTLKSEFGIKIAADESIRKNLDSDLSSLREYVDIAIIKWQPIGGFRAAQELVKLIGLPVVVSSALESGLGISKGLELAGALDVDLACGLGTVGLLESDIVNEPLEISNGEIAISPRTPNLKAIEKFQASEERRTWWISRISRIMESGGFDEYLN